MLNAKDLNLYSKETLNGIISVLEIKKHKERKQFQAVLKDACEVYLKNKDLNKNRLSKSAEDKKLEQLKNYLNKAENIYSELFLDSKGGIFRFLSALENLKTENKKEKE